MSYWTDLRTPAELELLVGLYDLTQYTLFSERTEPQRLLEIVTGYHAFAAKIIEEAGGIFIKPIGDAGLFAFRAEDADNGVSALFVMLERGDAWLSAEGYPGRARVGAHVGPVAVGRIGAQGREWLDVIGKTVNVVARVEAQAFRFAMTPAAFRSLSPVMRKRFKKHSPPASYIGADDPRPRGYWGGFEAGVAR